MNEAYVCGKLKRRAGGAWVLESVGLYSERAAHLTCGLSGDEAWCQFGGPFHGHTYEEACRAAGASLALTRARLGL